MIMQNSSELGNGRGGNASQLRRAELRQARLTRVPFVVGQWVLFYDKDGSKSRPGVPHN